MTKLIKIPTIPSLNEEPGLELNVFSMKSEVAAVKPVTTGGSETVGPSGGAISRNRKIRWRQYAEKMGAGPARDHGVADVPGIGMDCDEHLLTCRKSADDHPNKTTALGRRFDR